MNAYEVKPWWSCGWQVKTVIPFNTCHSVVLRDCLGLKNALYKYLILYFTFTLLYCGYVVWGSALSSASGSGQSPAAKCILVHFRHKFALFWVPKCRIISCVYSTLQECGSYSVRGSRPKSARPAPTFGSHCSRFHPNRFTFDGVIAERVKTGFCPVEYLQYRLFEPIINNVVQKFGLHVAAVLADHAVQYTTA